VQPSGVGVLTGLLCGALTGTLIAVFNMQPFIATLGIQGVYYGISLVLTDSVAILTKNKTFIFFGSRIGYIPMAAIIGVGVFLLILYVFHNTPFGRYIVAIGGNESGTRLSGVNTTFWKWFVYTFAGGITGFAGVLLAARLEAADPIVGIGWEFDAIAATILGGTSFQKGKGGVKGTALGGTADYRSSEWVECNSNPLHLTASPDRYHFDHSHRYPGWTFNAVYGERGKE
jgi:ribose transport system permease protein